MRLANVVDEPLRAFLSVAAEGGVPDLTAQRHISIVRPCLGPRDEPLAVASCAHAQRLSNRRVRGLLLLTRFRLVVTSETGLLRRLRLHLNLDLSRLADVAWTPEPATGGISLSATAVDGIREHVWIRQGTAERVHRLDHLLTEAFRAA